MASISSKFSFSEEKIRLPNWRTIADAVKPGLLLTTRLEYCVANRVGPFIYIAGLIGTQFDESGKWSSLMAVLDVTEQIWRWVPYEGCCESGSGVFLYGDSFYSFGPGDFKRIASGKLSRFDLVLGEWSYCHTVGEGPSPRKYFSGDLLEELNRYVVFGGWDIRLNNEDSNDVFILDIPQFRWTKAIIGGTPAPGRSQHGSCVHNGVIYVYGGWRQGARRNDGLFLLHVGRGPKVTWSSPRTNALELGPRSSFVFIPVGRVLVLCGGMTNQGVAGLAYYDLDLQEFKTVHVKLEVRYSYGSAACGAHIQNGQSFVIFNSKEALSRMTLVSVEKT